MSLSKLLPALRNGSPPADKTGNDLARTDQYGLEEAHHEGRCILVQFAVDRIELGDKGWVVRFTTEDVRREGAPARLWYGDLHMVYGEQPPPWRPGDRIAFNVPEPTGRNV